jgi:hypothetical protein
MFEVSFFFKEISLVAVIKHLKIIKSLNYMLLKWFLAYLLYLWKIKEGLWNHLAVCVSVYPPHFLFSMLSVLYQRKVDDRFFPELLVVITNQENYVMHLNSAFSVPKNKLRQDGGSAVLLAARPSLRHRRLLLLFFYYLFNCNWVVARWQ